MTPTARRGADDMVAKVAAALAPVLVTLVREAVREELRAVSAGRDTDPELPHWEWWFCSSRRSAAALAKSGSIEGVRCTGRGRGTAYLARRSALEAYVERQRRERAPSQQDDFEAAMARSHLRKGGAASGSSSGRR